MVTLAVQALISAVDLDDLGRANAAIAVALAEKLDEARGSHAAAAALAAPALAKELRAVIDAILESTNDSDEFVSGLFGEVGDTP